MFAEMGACHVEAWRKQPMASGSLCCESSVRALYAAESTQELTVMQDTSTTHCGCRMYASIAEWLRVFFAMRLGTCADCSHPKQHATL